MKRPVEIRAPPRDWLRVLKASYPFLRKRGVGDLVLFGSQALSTYLKNPLRSKDLDLTSSQIGPRHHKALTEELAGTRGLQVRSSTIQTRPLGEGTMTTYSVELRLEARPFFVEVFDKILDGKPPSLLAPHVRHTTKWNIDLWVPSPNALVALRLAFRQPEGISRLNASRLNAFIRERRSLLSFKQLNSIINEWGVGELVKVNLEDLHKIHRLKILHENLLDLR